MKRMFNGFTAVCLGLLMALPQGRISAQSLPNLRQGMPYEQARNLLLNQGWQAIYNPQKVNNPNRSPNVDYLISILGYSEVIDCSETGLGLCVLQFQNATGQTLNITTSNNIPGEQPAVFGWEISGRERPTNDGIIADKCQSTVIQTRQNLIKGRKLQVTIEKREHGYRDYPDGRSEQYDIVLQGPAASAVFNSAQLMLYSATKLIQNCNSVGMVRVGYAGSDYGYSIGLMWNNRVAVFECKEIDGKPFRWGEGPC